MTALVLFILSIVAAAFGVSMLKEFDMAWGLLTLSVTLALLGLAAQQDHFHKKKSDGG